MSDINSFIEDYYRQQQNKIAFGQLCEMIGRAMDEEEARASQAPEQSSDESNYPKAPQAARAGLDIAFKTLSEFFKENKNKVTYKEQGSSGNRTFFQNTGNAVKRNEAMLAVKEALSAQGIDMVLDIAYNNSPETGLFIGGSWEVPDPRKEGAKVKHSIVLKKGSGSTSGGNIATQFEGNVLVGIYNALGKGNAAAALAQELEGSGDIVVGQDQLQELADKIGAALIGSGNKSGISIKKVSSSSGGKVGASLTQTYLNHGVTSIEGKADIAINDIGVSVKKLEDSQFVSAQGPELAAIFDVAMRADQQLQEGMGQKIDLFVEQLQRATGSSSKKHVVQRGEPEDEGGLGAVQTRTQKTKSGDEREIAQMGSGGQWQTARAAVQTSTNAGTDRTGYQKILNKFLFADGASDEESAILDQAVGDLGTDTGQNFVALRGELSEILQSPLFKRELVKEAVTGAGKFNEDAPKAYGMLKWSMATPDGSYWKMIGDPSGKWDNSWFESAAGKAKLEIRDRGGTRGGSMRGEFGESLSIEFTELEMKEIDKHADIIYENMMGDQLLTEGVKDWISKGVGAAKKGAQWVADMAKKVVKTIAAGIAKLGAWLKKLLEKGVSFLMKLFGLEPAALEIQF